MNRGKQPCTKPACTSPSFLPLLLLSCLILIFFFFLPSWGLNTGLVHARRALNHFTTAPFSVCMQQGLVLLLRLGFTQSIAQAVLELVVLSHQPLEELRSHTCAPKPRLSFTLSKVNLSNHWLSPLSIPSTPSCLLWAQRIFSLAHRSSTGQTIVKRFPGVSRGNTLKMANISLVFYDQ